jgi:steroid delta-isomerase-like uncharacterized protein
MSDDTVRVLIDKFVYQPWNSGNLDALDGVAAADYRMNDDGSLEDLKQAIRELRSGFPDFTVSVDDVVAQGDRVAYRWTMTGTHQNEYEGLAATGKTLTARGMTFLRLQDGLIVEDRFESSSPSPEEQLRSS